MARLQTLTQTTYACDRCRSTAVTTNKKHPPGWSEFWFSDTNPLYRGYFATEKEDDKHTLYCQHCTAHLDAFMVGHATPERTYADTEPGDSLDKKYAFGREAYGLYTEDTNHKSHGPYTGDTNYKGKDKDCE